MKIQPALLQQTVDEILNDYAGNVKDVLSESITEVAKESNKSLKKAGDFEGTGKYKRSWRVNIEEGRLTTQARVYNRKAGLTHLLEFGHIKQNGQRSRYFEHIAPVNDKVQSEVVKKLEEKINDI